MKKITLLCILIIFIFCNAFAQTDTANIFSASMQKNIKCVIIKPDNYKKTKKAFPVLYLLHGYSGSYNNWIVRVPKLQKLATQHNILIVCPDGDFSSWYIDSPIDTASKYETHVGIEIPEYIDKNYKTIKDRKARAITGLSMGGQGALFLALRHSETFGACGGMSAAFLTGDIFTSADVPKRLGDSVNFRNNYYEYSITKALENYKKDSLTIMFDCGVDDFCLERNRTIHQKMLEKKIPHEYIERPGTHNWEYWANAIDYQLLFFRKYFDNINKNEMLLP